MSNFYRDKDLPHLFPGTSEGTWRRLRYQRKGPEFFMVGRVAFYREQDVFYWAQIQARKTEVAP